MHVLVMNKVDKAGESGNEKVNRDLFVQVPRGWSRALEKDSVVYFSPTSDCLRSKADVVRYLISDKTCKCGLECPLYVDNTFNFDASLQSRHFRIGQWDKASHSTKCIQTMKAVVNAFKQEPAAWMQTAVGQNNTGVFKNPSKSENEHSFTETDSVSSKVQLPSFETFTRLPEQKVNETLQGEAKAKKASQSTKRTGCYKRKSSAGAPVQSAVPSIAEKGHEIQECITVQSTNTPILHSFVKTNVAGNRGNDVVSSPLYPSVSMAPGAVPGVDEQRLPGINPNTAALLAFPSSHLNASSYLASLSSGSSPLVPNRAPFSHAGEMVRPSLPTAAPPHAFASKPSSFPHKPATSVFAAGASNTNNLVYFSGGLQTMTNHKPSITWQETPSLSVMSTHASNNSSMGKFTLGKSKGGLAMKTTGNVRNLTSPTSATVNRFSPQQNASPTTASSPAVCAASSLATPFAKTHVNQPDIALSGKSALNTHGQQTPRVNNAKLSENTESLPHSAVYSAAMMAHADKHKPRTPTAAGSKTAESVNQPFQYCGILLQPAGGMVPQVQVAGAASCSPNLNTLNIQGVDPSQFSNLYALHGIPYGNNVGNSGMFGMTPGTVLPYVLGITQTGSVAKSTAATTSTTKVASTSSSTPVSSSTATSTSSAAIAAAYSAFVSIAPASGTSPSYSQQLMNLVSSYNNPYWQQLLSHGGGSNALAYQLMQMNQYNALRGLAGQTAAGNSKTSSAKHSSSTQHQAKQASTITTASSSGSSRMSSQPVVPTPHVALVVVGSNDLSSVSTALNKVTSKTTAASSSSQSTVTAQYPVEKTVKTEHTTVSEPSVTNTSSSTSDCKASETNTTVTCSSTNDNTLQRTSDVPCKQDPDDFTSTKDDTPCNSERNDSKILSKEEDAKSIPEISHDTVNQEVASDDLKTPIFQQNTETTHADDSLRAHNNSTRTSESDITLAVDEKPATVGAINECSSVVLTNSDSVEDVSVDNVTADRCLNPDTENNISRCVVEMDIAPVQFPEDRRVEGNFLGLESNVDSVQSDDSEKNYEDEMETSVNEIVENGEAESTSNDVNSNNDEKINETPEVYQPVEFTIGDVVWAQARGLPSWPGKIVDERDVGSGSGRADNGKKWVMWFGDHTFSQVEVEKLKTLSDGLKTLDDKGKKRKYRGKKTRAGLQQAIREALEEVDQRDRLRSRQGPKAKKRRLRP